MLLDAVRSLAGEADRRAPETEALRRLPDDLAGALVDTGLLRAWVPGAYGGGGAGAQEVLDAIEALAYGDGATAWCGMIGATTSLTASFLPAEWAERIYGDPRAVTGGYAIPVGTGRPVEGGIVVDGRWSWGSFGHHCTWLGGGCFVDGLAAPFVFFERSQVELHDTWHVAGLKGTGSGDYEVRDAFVPEGRWVQVFAADPVVESALARMPFLGMLAVGVTTVGLGLARRAHAELVGLAGAKQPTGSSRSLAERPAIQADVARAEAAFRSAGAFLREVVAEAESAAGGGRPLDPEHARRIRLAATDATWRSTAAVDLMYAAGGGSSIHESSPLQRVFRDVHVVTQHGMVAARTYEPVGRMALGLPTDTRQL